MFELLVDQPPSELDLVGDPAYVGVESEWEGMSGAAVWVADRIVGIISAHVRSEGLGHLRATRLEHVYRIDDYSSRTFRELLHLPDGSDSGGLVDVVPASHAEKLALEFEGDFRDVAPLMLLDRERELEDLAKFCFSEERYLWLQAPAWSGKTALSSWLALNPPSRVSIVAFFIVKRQIGRADVNAFLDSVLAQLSIYDSGSDKVLSSLEEKRRKFGALLERAAVQALADGRRLTLLVDGLDEDVSGDINLPSIASILPTRPIQGLNVLVTSRPTPLPVDVQSTHSLRSCRIYELTPSPHAKALEVAAKQELAAILRGDDQLSIEILAFLTVSGGGLTSRELSELAAHGKISETKRRLEGALARSLTVHSGYTGEFIYLFGHATLSDTAREHFSDEQHMYAERLHLWAASYTSLGWTDTTPQFLMGRYFRLLSTSASTSLPRMIELAISEDRHDVMLTRTKGDWDALAEIEITRAALKMETMPELQAAAELSIERGRLMDRNAGIPLESGPFWARIGDTVRARMTADLITQPLRKSVYLAEISGAIAEAGDVIQAREVAEEVPDFRLRLRALAVVTMGFVRRKDFRNAEEIANVLEANAREFPDRAVRADFLTLAATAFSGVGQTARAENLGQEIEKLAAEFNQPKSPVKAAVEIAARLAGLGQVERAWRIAISISDPNWHAEALCAVAPYLPPSDARSSVILKAVTKSREKHSATELLVRTALALYPDASDLAKEYLLAAFKMTPPAHVPSTTGVFAIAAAVFGEVSTGIGKLDSMESVARVTWLCAMSRALSVAGRFSDALRCAQEAEVAATAMRSEPNQAPILIDVADSYLAAGRRVHAVDLVERAEKTARRTVNRSSAKHWSSVSVLLAAAGRTDCAEAIFKKMRYTQVEVDELRLEAVKALATAGEQKRALGLLRLIQNTLPKFKAYVAVLASCAQYGSWKQAENLLAESVEFYETHAEIIEYESEVVSLVGFVAMAGLVDKAVSLTASFAMANLKSAADYATARAAARRGEFDIALQFTALGYLETHRSRSAGVDGTVLVEVARALDGANVSGAMSGFDRLNDERLRFIAARWIRRSSLELTEVQNQSIENYEQPPTYVDGIGRALIDAEMPGRLSSLLLAGGTSFDVYVETQALIEIFEAAIEKGRVDLSFDVLREVQASGNQSRLILGYCLAAHGKFNEAWSVLKEEDHSGSDGSASRARDIDFLHESVQGMALVAVLAENVQNGLIETFEQVLPLFRIADPDALRDAIVVLMTVGLEEHLIAADVQSLLSVLRLRVERIEVLSRASGILIGQGYFEQAALLVRMILNMLIDAPADKRAVLFSAVTPRILSMNGTKNAFTGLCQEILSGSSWPSALPALAILDRGASDCVAERVARVCPAVLDT
ncbi:P-loop domain-containing protein [Arthrobacter sedimenti]|uniref:hypothetical protein n=1 Tax=Arthrobacter sedimenti TaxID=2694931 RepID=UPI00111E2EBE|nr:hypothetical protein [Arthrobacter sedimenti]